MKKVWIVKYQTPGRTNTKSFDTFNKAKLFARKLISKYSEVPQYLDDLRDGKRKKYRAAIADFFEKYFKDPHFPYSEADIPSDNGDDYEEKAPEGMIFGNDVDEDGWETGIVLITLYGSTSIPSSLKTACVSFNILCSSTAIPAIFG